MIYYYESFRYGGKDALNTVTNNLTQVSAPIEKNHNSHQPSHNTLKRPALSCPLMPIANQHFRASFKSYKLLTKNKITPPTTKAYTTLLVLLKPQTTK
jgi:hypothetical protein